MDLNILKADEIKDHLLKWLDMRCESNIMNAYFFFFFWIG